MASRLDVTARRGVWAGVLIGALGPIGLLILGILTQADVLMIGYWDEALLAYCVLVAMVPTTIIAGLIVGWSVGTRDWRGWLRLFVLAPLAAYCAWLASALTVKAPPIQI